MGRFSSGGAVDHGELSGGAARLRLTVAHRPRCKNLPGCKNFFKGFCKNLLLCKKSLKNVAADAQQTANDARNSYLLHRSLFLQAEKGSATPNVWRTA